MFAVGQYVVVYPKIITENKNKKTFWIGERGWDNPLATVGQIIKLESESNLCNLRLNDDSVAVCVSLGKIKPILGELLTLHEEDISKLFNAIAAKPDLYNVCGHRITPLFTTPE